MNKPELAAALAAQTKAPKAVTLEFVTSLFELIAAELERGNKVTLGNFGSFYPVLHKGRTTSHPTTKDAVDLPAQTLAKFRPSTRLKQLVNKVR